MSYCNIENWWERGIILWIKSNTAGENMKKFRWSANLHRKFAFLNWRIFFWNRKDFWMNQNLLQNMNKCTLHSFNLFFEKFILFSCIVKYRWSIYFISMGFLTTKIQHECPFSVIKTDFKDEFEFFFLLKTKNARTPTKFLFAF